MARFTAMSRGRQYRGFTIRLDRTDRYQVIEGQGDDENMINDRFQTIAMAMTWIDQTQFD